MGTVGETHGPLNLLGAPQMRRWDAGREAGSPVRLGVVGAQLLPEDPVTPWSGQKAGLPLGSGAQLHFLDLDGHLRRQSGVRRLERGANGDPHTYLLRLRHAWGQGDGGVSGGPLRGGW